MGKLLRCRREISKKLQRNQRNSLRNWKICRDLRQRLEAAAKKLEESEKIAENWQKAKREMQKLRAKLEKIRVFLQSSKELHGLRVLMDSFAKFVKT